MSRLVWRILTVATVIVTMALLLPSATTSPLPATANLASISGVPDVPDEAEAGLDDYGDGIIETPRDLTTDAEWEQLEAEAAASMAQLKAEGNVFAQSATAVSFAWPLRAADGLADYGYHGVSGFVDHDPAYPNHLLDYTCGDRTYDLSSGYNHKGTDFFTWPFAWRKVDAMEVEVVAAAPGTLVFKRDGQYDRNCAMSSALSNAVVIRHADGTTASYLHMKKDSLTTRPVGAWIEQGEYLGVVASSGSSTGPHLHFEIKDAAGNVLDPFEGDCNDRESMWDVQPLYYDSHINRVQTGFTTWRSHGCPNPESPNIRDSFAVTETVYFTAFYRDRLAGQVSVCSLYKPDSTLFTSWTSSSASAYGSASYAWWAKTLGSSAPVGTWRFDIRYEDETYQTYFNFGAPTYITVTFPSGGEVWKPGMVVPLAWKDNLGGPVRLDLLRDGEHVRTLTKATASDGIYFWVIPSDLELGAGYALRITNVTDPTLLDTSEGTFWLTNEAAAAFHGTPLTGTLPLTVTFTDDSTGAVTDWLWGFGDGITSTTQHPAHTYSDVGMYTVTLAVDGPLNSDVLTRSHYITVVHPPLVPNFHAWPILGTPSLTVTFTDRTTGPPILTWLWAFGDGATSPLQHTSHTYVTTGTYTVTLAVATADEAAAVMRRIRVVDRLWYAYLPVVSRE